MCVGGATCGRRGSGERENFRVCVLTLVSLTSVASSCPAVCPAPGLTDSCWAVPPASGNRAGQSAGRKPGIKGLTSQSGCPGALFETLAPVRPKAK